jgi:acyl-CoA thioesterase-1
MADFLSRHLPPVFLSRSLQAAPRVRKDENGVLPCDSLLARNALGAQPEGCGYGFRIILAAFLLSLIQVGPACSAEPEIKNILILGDSLAAGHGVQESQAFPALLQKKIEAEKLPFKVFNAGVDGDTSAGGLRRINWLLKRPTHVLVLELGGNDGLRGISPELTRKNLQGIIDKAGAKYPDIKIVIAGMQMPDNMGKEYTGKFRKVFPELAKANDAALIPFLLEGIGVDPRYNQEDLIHPNPEGHKMVAETVWKTLGPVLKKTEP